MNNSIHAKRTFTLECNRPELNATFEFERCESSAFKYGNHTCVIITRGGEEFDYCDTRYDVAVMKDFTGWCEGYLDDVIRKALEPKFTLIASSDE